MALKFAPLWTLALLAMPHLCQAQAGADTSKVAIGQKIYLEGVLPSGKALKGLRAGVGEVSGRDAACVACHRPSGLGTVEGNSVIPPITGRALFGGGAPVTVRADRLFQPGAFVPHPFYDLVGFSAAIRQGKGQNGQTLDALMPRYELNTSEVESLAAYLKTLSTDWSPGVTAQEIHLSSIILPGVSAERKQAFLSILQTAVAEINVINSPSLRSKVSYIERQEKSRRKWVLDIWTLDGPASTWAQQLTERQQANPAFAFLSGLGGDWQPVHDFCESQRIPCWFPSIDGAPLNAEQGNFGLYYSRGVFLEADVATKYLLRANRSGKKLTQLVSSAAFAQAAANRLATNLQQQAIDSKILSIELPLSTLQSELGNLQADDAVMLWLNQADLKRLADITPPATSDILFSGTLSGGEQAPPEGSWRQHGRLIQPLENPQLRRANLVRFSAWLKDRKLDDVDQRMQSEVYFATYFLWSSIAGMLNNLHTDYLIERAESTLSMREAMLVQEEIQAMMMGGGGKGPAALNQLPRHDAMANSQAHLDAMLKRRGTTIYPKLSLAPGQRIASQGAYLEKLEARGEVSADPEWIIP